jgi:serine/threonine protein kinase
MVVNGKSISYLRQAALPGTIRAEILARFETERQALASLDHPHIARVFDAGTSTRGRPFFAMMYIDGLPITEYCDRQSLTVSERLELFSVVCEAVDYAHRRGILHRDLKPSDILIAENAGKPAPKAIDFGIAKVMDARFAGRRSRRRPGSIWAPWNT